MNNRSLMLVFVTNLLTGGISPYSQTFTNKTDGACDIHMASRFVAVRTFDEKVEAGATVPLQVYGWCIDHIIVRGTTNSVRGLVCEYDVPLGSNRCWSHSYRISLKDGRLSIEQTE